MEAGASHSKDMNEWNKNSNYDSIMSSMSPSL